MSREKGFTLIESLIVVVISLIVIGALHRFFSSQIKGYLLQEELLEIQQHARIGTDFFSREVRMASVIAEATTGSEPLIPDRPAFLRFFADRNGNGTFGEPEDRDEEIVYQVVIPSKGSIGTLTRRSGARGSRQPLVPGIEGMVIRYLLADGTIRPDPGHPAPYRLSAAERRQIRRIDLTLILQGEKFDFLWPLHRSKRVRTFSTSVWPRNL